MVGTQTKDASHIPVRDFRQIYIWPLVLNQTPDDDWLNQTSQILSGGAWEEVEDPWSLMPDKLNEAGEPALGTYEEAVYFHDFVRDFLYKTGQERGQRLFTRTDKQTLTATIDGDAWHFHIDFCTLHVLRLGIAVLTLEFRFDVDASDTLILAKAQTIIDKLRRTYAPFWGKDGQPGLCPTDVVLDGNPCGLGKAVNRATAEAAMKERFREPLFPWWGDFLAPLPVEGTAAGDAARERKQPVFRQVLDERIPVITTLSLSSGRPDAAADLEQVSEGDWFRLAAADRAGTGAYPYNPGFLASLQEDYFYDRFMASPQTGRDSATRFLFAGYHFAAVGAGGFFDDLVTEHVRRHYRQMNFIVHLEFAALLMISSRLSEAAKSRDDEDAFRDMVIKTEKDFLFFTHTYRFTGVSNQLQAEEIYDKLRRSVGVDRLYRDVQMELQHATELALELDQRDAAQATLRLSEVATLGIVLGLVAGIMGMNVLVGEPLAGWLQWRCGWRSVGLDFSLAQFGGLLALTSFGTRWFVRKGRSARLGKWLASIGIAGILLATVGAAFLAIQNMDTSTGTNQPEVTVSGEQP